jgi:hypothetical protein
MSLAPTERTIVDAALHDINSASDDAREWTYRVNPKASHC